MQKIPATEFVRNFSHFREEVRVEPIAVMAHNTIKGIFVSPKMFKEYEELKARASKAQSVEEISEKTIQMIAASQMDKKHDHLNDLMDE